MTQVALEVESKRNSLPDGWKLVKLGEVASINPSRAKGLSFPPSEPTTFVPMPAIDERLGIINTAEEKPFTEVSKGYTYFEENDVLFAKISPCMQNGKHAIATDLINGFGFGSTEFHVIRPSVEICSDWIHKYLGQPHILSEAQTHFRGAVGQQRVPKEFLEQLEFPLPPLAEQKRIAAILNEQMAAVEKARKAAEARLEALQTLIEV